MAGGLPSLPTLPAARTKRWHQRNLLFRAGPVWGQGRGRGKNSDVFSYIFVAAMVHPEVSLLFLVGEVFFLHLAGAFCWQAPRPSSAELKPVEAGRHHQKHHQRLSTGQKTQVNRKPNLNRNRSFVQPQRRKQLFHTNRQPQAGDSSLLGRSRQRRLRPPQAQRRRRRRRRR